MSEFGAGLVVPLVKFSEHLSDKWSRDIERAIRWVKADPMEREEILKSNDPSWDSVLKLDEIHESPEHMLHQQLVMWAQGASDHLSDLDDRAPKSLQELASLMFKLRYGTFGEEQFGEEEWVKILALWSAAAMDLDEMLGVRPDWGEW